MKLAGRKTPHDGSLAYRKSSGVLSAKPPGETKGSGDRWTERPLHERREEEEEEARDGRRSAGRGGTPRNKDASRRRRWKQMGEAQLDTCSIRQVSTGSRANDQSA
ncbi:unnamed protein product [Pleuronectes platessa]|uniref:Uncharacterized protein n=1 Tax=Pleuronectes platessa TaxID=8262 RepID=A0A9N7YV99_PLEPL|nr:unnamed protein product [Pleuronectes platessa]